MKCLSDAEDLAQMGLDEIMEPRKSLLFSENDEA